MGSADVFHNSGAAFPILLSFRYAEVSLAMLAENCGGSIQHTWRLQS